MKQNVAVELERDLRDALLRDEFVLHYQPLRSLKTNGIVASEALVRWKSGAGELIPPCTFIPSLEKTGLIIPFGARMLDKALRQLRTWKERGLPQQRMSVNLSAAQFESGDLHGTVMRSIDTADVDPSELELEITESQLMHDSVRSDKTVQKLKDEGVRIAIDDFGTGYSSLAYLLRFPADTLKIDRTFIENITTCARSDALVVAIIGLAHRLGMEVVAEGVETQAQLAFLAREGCDVVQGFLCGRPSDASDGLTPV